MKKTILIVDDNMINRKMLYNILHDDYELIEAENGKVAFSLLEANADKVCAVVTDIVMPEMNGYELLHEIKSDGGFSAVPVIMVTGSEDEDSRLKAISLGASDFIMKPCNPDIIRHCVKNALALYESVSKLKALSRNKLTGLYTRETFFEQARMMCDAHESGYYTISCFDVENFKVINEQYGTQIGDKVLCYIANDLKMCARSLGGICCHYNADRFGILYPTESKESETILLSHERLTSPEFLDRKIKIRIGRYLIDDLSLPVSAMYDRAELAEESIRDRFDTSVTDYDESMRDKLIVEQKIVNDMTDALANSEFEPWFQPQYNHATGAIIGAEALVRWKKDGEFIPPYQFIPVFERNGFIYEMDKYIWNAVCKKLREWTDKGKEPLPISVNVSRRDLFFSDCIDNLKSLPGKYDLPIKLLRLEVTESAFAEESGLLIKKVNELIAYGFTVEIDDFGSGYSSLNTLKDVPAEILKLDMRFFEETANQQRGGNIIGSIVRMAKWLGMAVIAEGVEDQEQADYLKSIGCYYIQGYFYAKPMPVDEYEMLFTGGEAERTLTRLQTIETLNNNQFWDPKSMDTLIFNSYVGGACIFEYYNGKSELLRMNDRYTKEMNGLLPEGAQLMNASLIQFLNPEGRKALSDLIEESIKEKAESRGEVCLTNGKQTEYIRAAVRVIAQTGDRYLMYTSISNVTKEREAEISRAESAQKLAAIMENIGGGVSAATVKNGKVRYLFTNDKFYTMLGYTKKQFQEECPDGLADCLYPEDKERVLELYTACGNSKQSAMEKFRAVKRDGTVIWLHCNITMCSFGNEIANLAIYTDITEMKDSEKREAETTDRLKAVMNNMVNGITAMTICGDCMHTLFANEQFYVIHGVNPTNFPLHSLSETLELILPEDRERVNSVAAEALTSEKAFMCEYRILRPSDGEIVWIRASIKTGRIMGIDVPVQLTVYQDITAEKESEEQLQFLNTSAHDILATPDFKRAIAQTLHNLLQYFSADRSYVFEVQSNGKTVDNTFECCAEGIVPEIETLKNIPYSTTHGWFEAFERNEIISIADVDAIEEARREMRETLQRQNIKSLVAVPLRKDGRVIGFLGIDNPGKAMKQAENLAAIADYISVLLTRRDDIEQIAHDASEMHQLINDTPGGFIRVQIHPDKAPTLVIVNSGICRMLDMTEEQILKQFGNNAYALLNEEDIATVSAEVKEAFDYLSQYTIRCRLRRGDGSYIWTMVSGRFVKENTGELFLNSYFTDITVQKSNEEQEIELLNNLPSGAALYEFDGEKVRVIHINERYFELVGRPQLDNQKISVFGVFHPDDRGGVMRELKSAIRQNRNAHIDARIICGDGIYRPFHITTNNVRESNGKYLLYATFVNITEEAMSIQELIPIAMSTMMSASDDISYVLDRDRRFLCCSDSVARLIGLPSAEEIVGKSFAELCGAEATESFTARADEVFSSEKALSGIIEHVTRKDGSVRIFSTDIYPIRNSADEVIGVYGIGRDVTEQKQKESQLELLAAGFPGGLASYALENGNLKMLYFTDGYYRFAGMTRDEYAAMAEKDPMHLVLEEDRAQLRTVLMKYNDLQAKDLIQSGTFRCYSKTGDIRCIHYSISVSVLGDKKVLNVLQTDITDQKNVEQERIELLDRLPVGAAMYAFDGERIKALHLNKRYWELVGREEPSLPDISVFDAIHPDDHALVLQEIESAILQNRKADANVRIKQGDGSYKPFRINATILRREDGTYLLFAAYTPIAEDTMSVQSMFPVALSAMMSSSEDLSYVMDKNLRYICCSKSDAAFLGLANEKDIAGKTDYELFDRKIAEKLRADSTAVISTGIPILNKVESIVGHDGVLRYVNVCKYPLKDSNGDNIGMYGISRDITEQKENESQLELLTRSIPGGIATFRCYSDHIETVFFNDGLRALSGYFKGEYADKHIDPISFVFEEDKAALLEQLHALIDQGTPIDCNTRIHTANGGYMWINSKAVETSRDHNSVTVSAVIMDITDQQGEKEKLRQSEELNRLAIEQSGKIIARFNVAEQTLTLPDNLSAIFNVPHLLHNMPEEQIALGRVSPDTAHSYRKAFNDMIAGSPSGICVYQQNSTIGWRWLEAQYTTILSSEGKAVSAVVSFTDITERREKEAAYSKWQNSIRSRPIDSYTLFRCNITSGLSYDTREGELLDVEFDDIHAPFNTLAREFVRKVVCSEDAEAFLAFANSDNMLAEYYRGHRSDMMEFRAKQSDGSVHWMKLTVDLVEYQDSKDIEAYLMFEDIDEEKRAELSTIERAETDPLTGILNRATFITRMTEQLGRSKVGTKHAFFMLDIDNFKKINDTFGHGAGDQALIDFARQLQSLCRQGDLVARLGGDEFVMFISNIPGKNVATERANQICAMSRKSYGRNTQVTSSIGIAYYPENGSNFEELYQNADETLYRVKAVGKDMFASVGDTLEATAPIDGTGEVHLTTFASSLRKSRILIVDDSKLDSAMLTNMFKDDYLIEKAANGATALVKLDHYKSSVAVVLLDLNMPDMDGFAVLEKMQKNYELSTIPVIVVSADGDRETAIRAIRAGAADFVTKPVDPELLRIRVESTVSRAENEKLRAQNSYLAIQSDEVNSYRTVLDRLGAFMITLDWSSSVFTYSASVSQYLAGRYDTRSLWRILISDDVADIRTVQKLQQKVHEIANERNKTDDAMSAAFRSASDKKQKYDVKIHKVLTNYGLTEKIIMVFHLNPDETQQG